MQEGLAGACTKSELGLRPIYHQKQERSNGHLFITVLAYQLVQVIRSTSCAVTHSPVSVVVVRMWLRIV